MYRSPNTTTWSRHSRLIEPISRSACPFCHGERGAIGRSRMPMARSRRVKTSEFVSQALTLNKEGLGCVPSPQRHGWKRSARAIRSMSSG
jgi:hypothetical protein